MGITWDAFKIAWAKSEEKIETEKAKTLEEKYFDLKIEAICLMNEFRIVDAKMKEIERQMGKDTRKDFYEEAIKSMSNNLSAIINNEKDTESL